MMPTSLVESDLNGLEAWPGLEFHTRVTQSEDAQCFDGSIVFGLAGAQIEGIEK